MKKKTLIKSLFAGALVIIAGLFAASLIKTGIYNSKKYEQKLTGSELFTSAPGGEILSNFKSLENTDEGALYHHERYYARSY